MAAPGFSGFDVLVRSCGVGRRLDPAKWSAIAARAIEQEDQVLIWLVKAGHKPDQEILAAAGLDAFKVGARLLRIAVNSRVGFGKALDMLIGAGWPWPYIRSALD